MAAPVKDPRQRQPPRSNRPNGWWARPCSRTKLAPLDGTFLDYRRQALLSQEELAREVGVSRQTINAIERGRWLQLPSLPLALTIARRLGTTVEELFGSDRRQG